MLYDVFICHASEDKIKFVRPLAEELKKKNIEVWYDEFSLSVGDSIRRSIDVGLSKSRYGIVVLSRAFFEKNWTQYELDGLISIEMDGKNKVILPIWYNISNSEVLQKSPSLAGRLALNSKVGKKRIVEEILKVIHPTGSPLLEARDMILSYGLSPPVITDKYWLHVIEVSNRIPNYGAAIPVESRWGRWSFPMPSKDDWGDRLAWTAMQLSWIESAQRNSITPLTPPEQVLNFIYSNPGLYETCIDYPQLLVEYAPQLSIRGNGGKLEEAIENEYQANLNQRLRQKNESPSFGTGLTINKSSPLCDEEWSLRCEKFGNYKPDTISHAYFNGGMFGPEVSPYDDFEHLIWLFSESSKWLPAEIHAILLDGFHLNFQTLYYYWNNTNDPLLPPLPQKPGIFIEKLMKHNSKKKLEITAEIKQDILYKVRQARHFLNINESVESLGESLFSYQAFNRILVNRKSK